MLFVCCQDEWRFLLAGGTIIPKELENPAPDWLSDRAFNEVLRVPVLVSTLRKKGGVGTGFVCFFK